MDFSNPVNPAIHPVNPVNAFSAAVAAGADWRDAAMLANAAAGVVVGKVGTATVTPAELLAHYHEQEAN